MTSLTITVTNMATLAGSASHWLLCWRPGLLLPGGKVDCLTDTDTRHKNILTRDRVVDICCKVFTFHCWCFVLLGLPPLAVRGLAGVWRWLETAGPPCTSWPYHGKHSGAAGCLYLYYLLGSVCFSVLYLNTKVAQHLSIYLYATTLTECWVIQ